MSNTHRAQLPFDFVCDALQSCNLRLVGPGHCTNRPVGICTDSRHIQPGDLFFALTGECFDGHDFAQQALKAGAHAVVLRADRQLPTKEGLQLLVNDPLTALQHVAHTHLQRLSAVRIGITGSVGKTTTKELVKAVLQACLGPQAVLASTGNYNNHVGLPLSALQANSKHKALVFEMGMNHAGEIARLAHIAKPHIGLITNISYNHQAFFPNIEAIARAKGELFDALAHQKETIAIAHSDDKRCMHLLDKTSCRHLTFGWNRQADVRILSIHNPENIPERLQGQWLVLQHGNKTQRAWVPVIGESHANNAAAAVAVAVAMGLDFSHACKGLQQMQPVGRRLQVQPLKNDVLLLDDSYNASPKACEAALQVLQQLPANRRIACLGDMLELGNDAAALHRDVGKLCVQHGVSQLFACGPLSINYINGSLQAGMPKTCCHHFDNSRQLAQQVVSHIKPADAVLVKGSLSTNMHPVVQALQKHVGFNPPATARLS
ncbi:MAG: UDP-N-acetylmuramoyl-tripeptide--D-alanyl-D-alanine ligase [Myxococcota bacterium]